MVQNGKLKHALFGLLRNRRCRQISILTCVLVLLTTAMTYTRIDQKPSVAVFQRYAKVAKQELRKHIQTFKESAGLVPKIERLNRLSTDKCSKIPSPPAGQLWPEDEYIHDPKPSDVRDLVDPGKSRVLLEGSSTVSLGGVIRLRVELYDGYGKRKTRGGDLIRVWMKEDALGASSNGHVIDNGDGSYVTTLHAMWVGKPQIRAFVISPREVIAAQFRRRYTCPPVLTNTAVFMRDFKGEETPCNFDPEVPGYPDLCNLTDINYGRPWFCGKPRSQDFTCNDWEMAADMYVLIEDMREIGLSTLEKIIVQDNYNARAIPHNITIVVSEDNSNQTRITMEKPCCEIDKILTWQPTPPHGYMYKHSWQSRHCSIKLTDPQINTCLKNTNVQIIGDSTTLQLYEAFMRRIPCQVEKKRKLCANYELNYNLINQQHMLPFCTGLEDRTNFQSFSNNLGNIKTTQRTILVLHAFAHQINYQSHVFRETLFDMRKGITELLQRHNDVFIIIKGPHSYAIDKDTRTIMWMPDKYADVYQDMIFEMFSEFKDKVMFLDAMDITVSTEQWFIHSEDNVVDNIVTNILSHACKHS